ncbi:MAG: type VII secretion protein EccB [Pseudonocardia sediminis]
MQSRRDQVQAYFFVVGRMVAAVTHGRPDVLQAPNRRLTTGTALGVLVAALLVAIFGIYGLFVPGGNTSWRTPGAIVMDKNTGARFVFLDGQLRPVLNYASARLAAGNAGGKIVSVSQSSLRGTPVGQPIGIPGGPDGIPQATNLDRGGWTVCASPPADGAAGATTVSLLVGAPATPALSDAQAMLVSTPDGVTHLLWQGQRHRLGDATVVQALGYGDAVPVPVTPGWLNPIPSGRDIAVPDLGGAGGPGPVVDGRPTRIGQVLEVRNPAIDSDQLYLVRADGVTPLTRTTAAMVLAAPQTRPAYPNAAVTPVEVGPAALVGVPRSPGVDLVDGLPPVPPEAVTPPRDAVPCARFEPAAPDARARLEMVPASLVRSATVPTARHEAGTMTDTVGIPAGRGVLARELSAPGAAPGAAFLVTDVGVRYPLQDEQVMGALGYSESSVVPVPGALLDLLPAGPVLSVAGALQEQAPDS